VKTKEDVTWLLKSYRKWIDHFGQKRIGASNDLGYCESYRIKLCFASGNIVLNETNHYSKGGIQSSQIEWS
jgi:hypothetical protein